MDEVDRTQLIAEVYANALLKKRLRNSAAHAASRETCKACGKRIPAARRIAIPGVELCVRCQEEKERGGNA